ncbi:MAG: hypothetical protein ABI743_04940 [bacterium]
MAGPPLLKSDQALDLVVTAWSGACTLVALGCLGYLFGVLEPKYVTFDVATQQYFTDKLPLELLMLKYFGVAMMFTGLAIMPLYQKDPSAAGDAPQSAE